MTIYIDMLFLMHFIVILFVNFISLKFTNIKVKNIKIILVSLVSAFFSSIIYVYNLKSGTNVVVYYLIMEFLNIIALIDSKNFSYTKMIKSVVKLIVSQFIVVLISFSVILVILESNYTYTFKVLVCSFFATYSLVILMYKLLFDIKLSENFKYDVEIILEEDFKDIEEIKITNNLNTLKNNDKIILSLNGFFDSGNLSSYFGKPVSFLRKSKYLEKLKEGDKEKNYEDDNKMSNKYDEWIEVKTAIGIERLKLIRPLRMVLKSKDKYNYNKVIEKPYLGLINDENLTSDIDVILNKNIFV